MKAVVVSSPRSAEVREVPVPELGPKDVLVRVMACGICGTDLHIYNGTFMPHYPLTPGHEFSGVIAAIGSDVRDLEVGMRVAVDPSLYCHECYYCKQNMENHCLNWGAIGDTTDGAFAEYAKVPARNVYQIDDGVSFAEAAFVEPISCVVYALRRAAIPTGSSVLILGAGPMGILLTQLTKRGGASNVTVVDINCKRLAMAGKVGADRTVPGSPGQNQELAAIAPRGFDVVIDVTGVPAVVEQAFRYLGKEGTFLQFGVCPPDSKATINPYDVYHNDWRIIGSFALRYTFYPARDLLAGGAVQVLPLISHILPIDDYVKALETIRGGQAVKVLLSPDPAAVLEDLVRARGRAAEELLSPGTVVGADTIA